MKTAIKTLSFVLIFGLLLLIGLGLKDAKRKSTRVTNIIQTLPSFDYISVSTGKPVNKPGDKATVLNYFNTNCQYCQYEIKDFLENLSLFQDVRILFFSDQHLDTLYNFTKYLGIDTVSNIDVCQIDYLDFAEKFGDVIPPTTFIYDSNNVLIHVHKGQIRVPIIAEQIIKHYQQNETQ